MVTDRSMHTDDLTRWLHLHSSITRTYIKWLPNVDFLEVDFQRTSIPPNECADFMASQLPSSTVKMKMGIFYFLGALLRYKLYLIGGKISSKS